MSVVKPMPIKSPAWRLEEAKAILESGSPEASTSCSYIKEAIALLGGRSKSVPMQTAYLMYRLPEARATISSLLLNDPPIDQIAASIQSDSDTVLFYSKIFFDTSVFPNRLVLKEFLNVLPERTPAEAHFKTMLQSAYNLGADYIVWKKGLITSEDPDLTTVTTNLLLDSYWRAREHKAFSLDSSATRESRAWLPQVLRSIDATKNIGNAGESNIETLRLKLVKQDTTVSLSALKAEDIKG